MRINHLRVGWMFEGRGYVFVRVMPCGKKLLVSVLFCARCYCSASQRRDIGTGCVNDVIELQ